MNDIQCRACGINSETDGDTCPNCGSDRINIKR